MPVLWTKDRKQLNNSDKLGLELCTYSNDLATILENVASLVLSIQCNNNYSNDILLLDNTHLLIS